MLNHFLFKKFGNDYLLTNDLGYYTFLPEHEFHNLVINKKPSDPIIEQTLKEKFFIYETSAQSFSNEAKYAFRRAKNYLFQATALHIFVVSVNCNLKCIYCQAQNGKTEPHGIMDKMTAKKAIDLALQSPEQNLSFEFQGGEPLTNFETIEFIVKYAEENKKDKNINYSIVSNLLLMTDEMITFFKEHNISVSTSLDGGQIVHDYNRPMKSGQGTFEKVVNQIKKLRENDVTLGAIQTTTKLSLSYAKEIISTYLDLGFSEIFIRPLTPLGTALGAWNEVGYSADDFVEFYRSAFDEILKLNKNGIPFKEQYASILLQKILFQEPVNYMELRSPCGAVTGQIAYYHNGDIFTCDEGRMMYEMGDSSFLIGNVHKSSYDDLINSRVSSTICKASILEGIPSCCDCVYQPYCGICPVINYAIYHDIYPKEFETYKCQINKGILDYLFNLLKTDHNAEKVLRCWL